MNHFTGHFWLGTIISRLRVRGLISRRWTAAFRVGGIERTLDALRRIPQLVRNRVTQQLRGRYRDKFAHFSLPSSR